MVMQMKLEFAPFVLDMESGDLRRGDAIVDLRPKLHALLVHLVENPGRLMTKEELMSAVWSDVFVADQTLNRSVSELRDVLGDGMIETVPRRGYRFVAEVRSVDGNLARVPSMFALVHRERSLALFEGENILGRTPDCDVQIPAPSVSRRHARIVVGAEATIEDLGSTNGTKLNEQPLSGPAKLQPGDPITVGREALRFVSSDFNASTERISD